MASLGHNKLIILKPSTYISTIFRIIILIIYPSLFQIFVKYDKYEPKQLCWHESFMKCITAVMWFLTNYLFIPIPVVDSSIFVTWWQMISFWWRGVTIQIQITGRGDSAEAHITHTVTNLAVWACQRIQMNSKITSFLIIIIEINMIDFNKMILLEFIHKYVQCVGNHTLST